MPHWNSHTSTLFHYTKSEDIVISILKTGLKFAYCKEQINDRVCIGIPMISFCDIPLVNSVEHTKKYGHYAIGLSKDYLLKEYAKGIGPVNYYTSEMPVMASFKLLEISKQRKKVLNDYIKAASNTIECEFNGIKYSGRPAQLNDEGVNLLKAFFESNEFHRSATFAIGLMKSYKSIRDGKEQINYDECEWRMVYPEYAKLGDDKDGLCKWFWSEEEYNEWRSISDKKFLSGIDLAFEISDVNYIIVPTKSKAVSMIEKIEKLDVLCNTRIGDNERRLLISKVISFEEIEHDF